ncbi:MAG: hypothetical protein LKE40_03725 [Spirochaetia bacterium]|nr:hypothetical protein [Spirochaetia bacterium]
MYDRCGYRILVASYAVKLTAEEVQERLARLLASQISTKSIFAVIENRTCIRKETEKSLYEFIETTSSVHAWIKKEIETHPFDPFVGPLFRCCYNPNGRLVLMAHPLVADAPALVALAKAMVMDDVLTDSDTFHPWPVMNKLPLLQSLKLHKIPAITCDFPQGPEHLQEIKVRSFSVDATTIFSLCSKERISVLSFFICIALSLNQGLRMKFSIPLSLRESDDTSLADLSPTFRFVRGFDHKITFYDNCRGIDRILARAFPSKQYLLRSTELSLPSLSVCADPTCSKETKTLFLDDFLIDRVSDFEIEKPFNSLEYYTSSSYVRNSFGITGNGDSLTISTIVHDKVGDSLVSSYQKTLGVVSKGMQPAMSKGKR